MNNIEEKAIIDIKNSYETISIEPNQNADEYLNKNPTDIILSTGNNRYLTYSASSSLPLSSEENALIEETNGSSKIDQMYQMIRQKTTQVLEMIKIEKSYAMFFGVLTIGVILLFLSLLMLPMFLLTPVKFIFTFGTGSIIIVFSFVFLYGLTEYCQMLFEHNRKWLTLSFFISILLGLVFAWRKHFLLSLVFAVYQMIAVIMFTLSFIPGGQNGIMFIIDILKSPFVNIYNTIKSKFALVPQDKTNDNQY